MIRTRFAPSPTGYLHVGGLRTALYCYLFARKNNGKFLLRIEDTDQERFVEGAVENLLETLKWVGLEYDEGPLENGSEKGKYGPYIQSKRTETYKKHADELLAKGAAYRCFCTKDRLDDMRARQTANKQAPMYDRHCLNLPDSEIQAKLKAGEIFVIRQKIPYETIKFNDMIRGNVQFDGKTIDDQVLVKSDGFPTYHLANVVDDHLMEITHVIRGEEWLPSTPKHIALYRAFGWTPPEFAHIPLLLNADKTKLSKRQGHVSVEEYINAGYLREAIINFVTFLGWHPGSGNENEIYTLQDLEKIFTLEKVHKAGAIFNIEKLDWFNWRWQKQKHTETLEKLAKEIDPEVKIEETRPGQFKYIFDTQENEDIFLAKRGKILLEICNKHLDKKSIKDEKQLLKALVTVEEKILRSPKEIKENIEFYFELPHYEKDLLTHEKLGVDYKVAKESVKAATEDLEKLDKWTPASLEKALQKTVEKLHVQNGQVFWPARAALSGLKFSPGVFELAWVLGKKETLKRLKKAYELL
ncbi:glutamate--tRNA ligase [Candidatus Peregrinibacteria bacterium]|nr:glutamate--tRNA ligase [Candidatus Peregrinibacteria bacterium]